MKPHDTQDIAKSHYVKAYNLYHNVPCRGYGIIERRNRLKPEFKQYNGKEIAEYRKITSVTEIHHIYQLAYLCDTTIEVLKGPDAEELLKYNTIMIECTFIDSQVKGTHHIYYQELKPYILEHSEITWILFHFSARYTVEELESFFKKEDIPNVIPWLN